MKLNPGDEISFNDIVGEISEATGFKMQQLLLVENMKMELVEEFVKFQQPYIIHLFYLI